MTSSLKISDYWPEQKPEYPPFHHGWINLPQQDGNRRGLLHLIEKHQVKNMIELGSWYGMSARFLMENTKDSEMTLFCVDYWDNEWMYNKLKNILKNDPMEPVLKNTPFYETFMVNLWEFRDRIVPLQMSTLDGLKEIKDLNMPIDLIYIDATHTYEAVKSEIELALQLFPAARLCGDDYHKDAWPGVIEAVDECAKRYGFQVHLDGPFWWYGDHLKNF